MRISDFDFPLSEDLIASTPLPERDASRLMVLPPEGVPLHRTFRDLPDFLRAGDLLVLNRTRVLPCRLRGMRDDGGEADVLLVRPLGEDRWEVLTRGRYRGWVRVSDRLDFELEGGGTARLRFEGDLTELLWAQGEMPLPPYLRRRGTNLDKERYQTVYARDHGSIAAPTAGLHFTPSLLEGLRKQGVHVRFLTLHVGRGTFVPVRVERVEEHAMEPEEFAVSEDLMTEVRARTGRLVTVGTTATRALEAVMTGRYSAREGRNGTLRGSTDLFIHPGYRFRAVDGIITNFHLPRSTPLLLAAALAGRRRLLRAYEEARRERYRFFSYGDAMLIL
jgi:S-adenosylmethionine:tRNA ribosyltransferase-isomerase